MPPPPKKITPPKNMIPPNNITPPNNTTPPNSTTPPNNMPPLINRLRLNFFEQKCVPPGVGKNLPNSVFGELFEIDAFCKILKRNFARKFFFRKLNFEQMCSH